MKYRRNLVQTVGAAAVVAALGVAPAFAGQPEQAAPAEQPGSAAVLHEFAEGVREFKLKNGLRILFYRRGYAPVFAGQVWVKVGGVNEQMGRTGAAHLLEHMAFKGTTKIGTKDYAREKELLAELEERMQRANLDPKSVDTGRMRAIYEELSNLWIENEFSKIYSRQGAVGLNAATAKDYTFYMVELPSADFELWCWMESERILNPVFRQFYKEREVVMEERRMRTDDSPTGRLYETLLATAYQSHPNRFPVIGWASDIRGLMMTDTAKIHRAYYRPDNMVLAVVGDLDPEKVQPLLEKYFGRLPAGEGEIPRVTTVEEPQQGPREAVIYYDAQPTFAIAFHKPVYPNHDDIYFSVLHSLLSSGRSSILHRELVLEKQLATNVFTTEAPGDLFPSLFLVGATPREGVSNERLRDEVQKILDRLKSGAISEADFAAAKKRVKISFLGGMDSNQDIAETLGQGELIHGDWRSVLEMYDITNKMTVADVQRLANTYFTELNRTYVHRERPVKAVNGAKATAQVKR